ncbi:MAG: hypothetical protein AABY79_08000 [Nitrospirota bacterium]
MLLLITTASAGTLIGKRIVSKFSHKAFKLYVAGAIIIIGIFLSLRII